MTLVAWSGLTVAAYLLSKRLYARWRRWWLMPLALTPAFLLAAVTVLHVSYATYIGATGWLVALLGPATVAFAVPIYAHRDLVRRQWPVLAIAMIVGSVTALATSYGLASLVGLDDVLRRSLLPRSISTPFAMAVSHDLGGIPDLTAVFVVLTGIIGAIVGETMLARLPLRSSLARGALFGVGAHGAGTAKAQELGATEGAVAGLVMVLVGLLNVLVAPLVALVLG